MVSLAPFLQRIEDELVKSKALRNQCKKLRRTDLQEGGVKGDAERSGYYL